MAVGHECENYPPSSLRLARTCYAHLAGKVAVNIYDAMLKQTWLSADGSALTVKGQQQFALLGITLNPQVRRKKCSACLDWSERRFHLGGEAGAVFFCLPYAVTIQFAHFIIFFLCLNEA